MLALLPKVWYQHCQHHGTVITVSNTPMMRTMSNAMTILLEVLGVFCSFSPAVGVQGLPPKRTYHSKDFFEGCQNKDPKRIAKKVGFLEIGRAGCRPNSARPSDAKVFTTGLSSQRIP